MTPLRKFSALAFVLVAAIGGGLLFYRAISGGNEVLVHATVLPAPVPVPAFTLTDEDGNPFTREDLEGQWNLLFFGFTNCPDICPATLQQLAIARSRINELHGRFPQIVLVSVDPRRDSPEVLARYVENFGSDVKGLTGPDKELRRLTAPLGIYFQTNATSDSNYSVDHSAVVLVIDDAAMWRALFSAPHSVDDFVNDIPILTGAD